MRTLIAIIGILVVASARAAASPPSGYACDSPDEEHERCRCGPGQQSSRDGHNRAVCVAKPARQPPVLLYPAAEFTVPANATFRVTVPSWADAVRIEICNDAACRDAWLIRDASPDDIGYASLQVNDLPPGKQLFWRATGRAGGNSLSPSSAVSRFRVAPSAASAPPPAPASTFDLARVDALISSGDIDGAVTLAGTSPNAADHVEVARRLANTSHCDALDRVFALPAAQRPSDLDAQIEQVRRSCTQVAGSTPPVSTETQVDPSLSPPPRTSGFAGIQAMTSYRQPLGGARTAEGTAYTFGIKLRMDEHDDSVVHLVPTLLLIQPLADGPSGRAGNVWAAGVRVDAGMRDTSRIALRFGFQEVLGGGRFAAVDDRHGVALFEVCPGGLARLALGAGFGLSANITYCAGVMYDVSHFGESGPAEMASRWHGTSSADLGVILDWSP